MANQLIEELNDLSDNIKIDKLQQQIKKLDSEISKISELLKHAEEIKASMKENKENILNKNKSSQSSITTLNEGATLDTVNQLRHFVDEIDAKLKDLNRMVKYNDLQEVSYFELNENEVQQLLDKFSNLVSVIQKKKIDMEYSTLVPPNLDEVTAFYNSRLDYFRQLQIKIDVKVAEKTRVQDLQNADDNELLRHT